MALQTFCKIVGGNIVARELKDNPDVKIGGDGFPIWRPFIPASAPAYDPATHHPPVRSEVIQNTQVVETWAAPVAKTAQEIDDEKTAKATSEADVLLARLVKRLMATQFALVNVVRANNSQAPIDANTYLQFFDASADDISDQVFINKMKALID